MIPDQTLDSDEVAALLGCSQRLVRKIAPQLGGKRPLNSRAWRFNRSEVLRSAAALGMKLPEEPKQPTGSASSDPSNTQPSTAAC